MNKLQIADTEYSIERKSIGNFNLVWESHTEVREVSKRTGKGSGKPKTWTKFYGSLSQALCGFVKCYTESYPEGSTLDDIQSRVEYASELISGIMDALSETDKKVLEEWKVVRVSKG